MWATTWPLRNFDRSRMKRMLLSRARMLRGQRTVASILLARAQQVRQSKELCRRASALSGRRECGRARQRLRTGPLTEAGGPGGGRARWRARWARPRWCGRCASAPSTSAAGWARGWAARRRSTGARSGTAWSRRRAIFHCAQPPLRLSHLCSTSSRVACTALTVMYLYVSNLLYICMVKSEPAMALTVLRRRGHGPGQGGRRALPGLGPGVCHAHGTPRPGARRPARAPWPPCRTPWAGPRRA